MISQKNLWIHADIYPTITILKYEVYKYIDNLNPLKWGDIKDREHQGEAGKLPNYKGMRQTCI